MTTASNSATSPEELENLISYPGAYDQVGRARRQTRQALRPTHAASTRRRLPSKEYSKKRSVEYQLIIQLFIQTDRVHHKEDITRVTTNSSLIAVTLIPSGEKASDTQLLGPGGGRLDDDDFVSRGDQARTAPGHWVRAHQAHLFEPVGHLPDRSWEVCTSGTRSWEVCTSRAISDAVLPAAEARITRARRRTTLAVPLPSPRRARQDLSSDRRARWSPVTASQALPPSTLLSRPSARDLRARVSVWSGTGLHNKHVTCEGGNQYEGDKSPPEAARNRYREADGPVRRPSDRHSVAGTAVRLRCSRGVGPLGGHAR